MSDKILDFFTASSRKEEQLRQESYLFHEGDPVRHLYLVVDGEVQLLRHQQDGMAVILQRAKAGNVIAEASVFSENYHCNAFVRATARLRSVTKDEFLNHFQSNPAFALSWAARLAREVQATRLRSEILSLNTVSRKLDAWIAWHGPLPQKGEWNQIALQIGVSAEALYREIAKRRKVTAPWA